jgi:hypothetical protein
VENSPSLVICAPFNFIARRHRHKQVHQSAISIGKRATAAAKFNQAGRDIILFAPSGSRARRERSFLIKPPAAAQ